MTPISPMKTCRDCSCVYPRVQAPKANGNRSLWGFYFPSWGTRKAREYVEFLHQREINIARNLWVAHRGWWKHFTPPHGWKQLLRCERKTCLYCGCLLTDDLPPRAASTAVIDHMDPLSLGVRIHYGMQFIAAIAAMGLRKKNCLSVGFQNYLNPSERSRECFMSLSTSTNPKFSKLDPSSFVQKEFRCFLS